MTKKLIQTSGLVAGLDIGTQKICCAIGRVGYDLSQEDELSNEPRINIIGVSQVASKGVKYNGITDIAALEKSILNALNNAEEMAGKKINSIYVNVPTSLINIHKHYAEMNIPQNTPITQNCMKKLLRIAKNNAVIPGNQEIIGIIPLSYRVDELDQIDDPVNLMGKHLSATCSIITSSKAYTENIKNCIGRCNLDVGNFVADPFASSLACMIDEEISLGCTLIDIGGKITQISCFYKNNLTWVDFIPVGGDNITSDLARCLDTSMIQAERIKNLYGSLLATHKDSSEYIQIQQLISADIKYVQRELVLDIIKSRVEEIFVNIIKHMQNIPPNILSLIQQKIIITGGTCSLHGIGDFATNFFDTKVRIANQNCADGQNSIIRSPAFSTCAGLLNYATGINFYNGNIQQEDLNLLQRLKNWVKNNI